MNQFHVLRASRILGCESIAYDLLSLLLLYCGNIPSRRLRHFLYKNFFRLGLHPTSTIYHGCEIRCPSSISIDRNSAIGDSCILDGRMGITIGKSVNLSSGVWIWTLQHDPHDPYFGCKGGKVTIHDYAWISCRSVILPGVTIGRGSVIAAGAVVTKDVPPFTIVGGVPAKVIGHRRSDLDYAINVNTHFW
jgi:acetyltransferase-like isoleucine patch superfamily enzyme